MSRVEKTKLKKVSKKRYKSVCKKLFMIIMMFITIINIFLIDYRINKSIELLSDRNLSITDIAFMVGFNSASHYTEIFKKLIGRTPNQLRKTLN